MAPSSRLTSLLVTTVFTLIAPYVSARVGGTDSGGGDLCENRIQVIRDDIQQWILKGGSNELKLPASIAAAAYSAKMMDAIRVAKIKCVGPQDRSYPVRVFGVPKTCRFDRSRGLSQITCDLGKFNSANESDQYVLVHHELAGLAQLERPDRGDSNYTLSNQIAGHLRDTVVKKLVVSPAKVAVVNQLPSFATLWDQPLSSLDLSSKLSADLDHVNFLDGVYQDGHPTSRGGSDEKPFCTITSTILPSRTSNESRTVEFSVTSIRTMRTVQSASSNRGTTNWTTLELSSSIGGIHFVCGKISKDIFLPVSIAEAQAAVGERLSFDQISVKRVVSLRTYERTYPQDYALAPSDIIGTEKLKAKIELPIIAFQKHEGDDAPVSFLQDGRVVTEVDRSKPYAYIAVTSEHAENLIGTSLKLSLEQTESVDVSTEAREHLSPSGDLVIHAKLSSGLEFGVLFSVPGAKLPTAEDIRIITGQAIVWQIR